MTETTYRIGVDIGGTFTDIVVLRPNGTFHTKKISSTVDDYSRAIMLGLATVLEEIGAAAAEVEEIRHGTTVASNTILERKGARTGLITTEGFRDVLEIRTLRMPRLYDMTWKKPPVAGRRAICAVTVNERVDARGNIRQPLDPADAERAVRRLLDQGVEAIAVCLLHAYANPAHERLLKEIIELQAPDLPFAISFDVLPEIKEYERTSTTVINAYVMPIVAAISGRSSARPREHRRAHAGHAHAVEWRAHDLAHRRGPARCTSSSRVRPAASSAPRRSRPRSICRRSSPSTWVARPRRRRWSRRAR